MHLGRILQEPGEFLPLSVVARPDNLPGLLLQPLKDPDLSLQFVDRLRGGGLVNDLLLVLLVLVGGHLLVGVPGVAVCPHIKERLGGLPAAHIDLHLFHAAGQPLATSRERLEDCLGTRCQPPLQPGESEPDRTSPLLVHDQVSLVHLLLHVPRDLLVEGRLGVGEGVVDSFCNPFGEEGCPIELQEILLHHPAHQVRDIHLVGPVPEFPVEPVCVQQGEEELEVLLLPVMRRRRHQEEVAGMSAEQFPQPESLGLVHLRAVIRRRHLVGLVHHHEIPLRTIEFLLQVLIAGELVEPGNQQGMIVERVATERLFREVTGEDSELKAELLVHLVLPLLHEAPWGDDQDPLGVGPHQELADQETSHDRLAGAGVVRKDEPQRLPGEHRLIDRRDLVGERFDVRGMHRHHRIEEVGEVDPVGLGGKFEPFAGCVERPRPPGLREGEGGFAGAEEHLLFQLPVGGLVIDRQRVLTDRLSGDNMDDLAGLDTVDGRIFLDIFQS